MSTDQPSPHHHGRAELLASIALRLDDDDDPALWEEVLATVMADARALVGNVDLPVRADIGRCSHWLRPHQTRWTADGGLAWPAGYGDGAGDGRTGLPNFDWSCAAEWDAQLALWRPTSTADSGRHQLMTLRVAVPSRTRRHDQAVVHTLWKPGPPQHPDVPLRQFYGFRRKDGIWRHTAYSADPDDAAYERTP